MKYNEQCLKQFKFIILVCLHNVFFFHCQSSEFSQFAWWNNLLVTEIRNVVVKIAYYLN